MIRENYITFWSIFFALTAIGGGGIIFCLALIARYLKEISEKMLTLKLPVKKPKINWWSALKHIGQ